jgi:prepilin-type N-terminal cleavage/methylation domain-containing protein
VKKRRGFTLVELLIVMAILSIMITVAIGIINPIAMTNKATDARVKKDLRKIRVAFEEYRSDKKGYPDDEMLTKLSNKSNCGSGVFAPWLSSWLCDPSGEPYRIVVEGAGRTWFKVFTKLRNVKDNDIPVEVKERIRVVGDGLKYNYGVSSTNVIWYGLDGCGEGCSVSTGIGCNDQACIGGNCYAGRSCLDICQVASCNYD